MTRQGETGIRRIISATVNSIAGLKAAWVGEAAFRQECLLFVAMLPVAFWVGRNAVEWSLLVGTCLLVLITELLNSAIEAAIDRIGTEYHPLSGRAKDIGSAAVFLALLLAGTVWSLVAWQNFAG